MTRGRGLKVEWRNWGGEQAGYVVMGRWKVWPWGQRAKRRWGHGHWWRGSQRADTAEGWEGRSVHSPRPTAGLNSWAPNHNFPWKRRALGSLLKETFQVGVLVVESSIWALKMKGENVLEGQREAQGQDLEGWEGGNRQWGLPGVRYPQWRLSHISLEQETEDTVASATDGLFRGHRGGEGSVCNGVRSEGLMGMRVQCWRRTWWSLGSCGGLHGISPRPSCSLWGWGWGRGRMGSRSLRLWTPPPSASAGLEAKGAWW